MHRKSNEHLRRKTRARLSTTPLSSGSHLARASMILAGILAITLCCVILERQARHDIQAMHAAGDRKRMASSKDIPKPAHQGWIERSRSQAIPGMHMNSAGHLLVAGAVPCQNAMSAQECRQCRDEAMRSDPTIVFLLKQIRSTPCGMGLELMNITCAESAPTGPTNPYASTWCRNPASPRINLYADQFCAADCETLTAKLANELTNALDCCSTGIDLGNPATCDECFLWGCTEYRSCRMEGRESVDCWNDFFRWYFPSRPPACRSCGLLPGQLFAECGDPRDGAPGLPPIYAPPHTH